MRTGKGKAARDNIELDDEALDVKMLPEAAEGAKNMDEVGDDITRENKAVDVSIAAGEEEARKIRGQAMENEAMTRRIRDLSASGGRRNSEDIQDDKDEGSDDEVANSTWAKSSLPAETNQRKKKTNLPSTKPKDKCVLFIKATVNSGSSPPEGIRDAVKTIFTELSVHGGITGLKILQNNKTGSQKPITLASIVLLKWGAASKYVTCINE